MSALAVRDRSPPATAVVTFVGPWPPAAAHRAVALGAFDATHSFSAGWVRRAPEATASSPHPVVPDER
jgi:hypothetical protein